jgi:uncharacterized protein
MKGARWLRLATIVLISGFVVAYLGMCARIGLTERKLVFRRDLPVVALRSELAWQPETVQIGKLEQVPLFAWIVRSRPSDAGENAWVLFFHGNRANLSTMQNEFSRIRDLGFNILAPEYPGFAGKPGEPTESSVEQEAQIVFEYLQNALRVPPGKIVIWGRWAPASQWTWPVTVKRAPWY